ncbi:MAG: hypothetical protein A2275_01215 [Bacteroidetes bacterium RIFOXYA12_FULL_35_11]|nr:MAG: hypothetical protein A2X01_20065 [Bacteroidetes bacterium GWF2_35_48]OFY74550.1 MAG: hypothetical protein A2275_01215 [Bacteroidetes bacterium RIFOXYA12_FULL_35_11]OFZ02251.1 MAG: hypothetical protein A2491_06150 [Bacteroidetes bacterium RIFOXYC12_FULL_35_7]HBX52867.1 ABC transporter permease [Bacteroidales bacterium]
MNIEFFIAKRLISFRDSKKSISRPIVTIAIIGIALGLATMIISVSVVVGFKNEIRSKVSGFGSHFQVMNYDTNESYETKPIKRLQNFIPELLKTQEVKHCQAFALKAGIIKTEHELQGVVVKGVGSDYDWEFFKQYMIKGTHFTVVDSSKTNDVIISSQLANQLKLKLGDKLPMYFIQDSPEPRMRKFKISGIFQTNLEEFDKSFVIADISHVQKLNNWDSSLVSGFEIQLHDFDNIDKLYPQIDNILGYQITEGNEVLKLVSIKEKYPQIFDWLDLQDINVWIILGLMVIVAGFNMVSGLLILILEKTKLIGILKSVGAENASIRKIFLYQAGLLISKGLLWGNITGLAFCFLQKYFNIIHLDAAAYYVSSVPVSINIMYIVILNLGTLAVTLTMLLLPSFIITRISPVKAIQFN